MSTKERLVQDAGLTLHERIIKLKREDKTVELKPFMLQVHFKKNKIKQKVISDVYEKKARDAQKDEDRY